MDVPNQNPQGTAAEVGEGNQPATENQQHDLPTDMKEAHAINEKLRKANEDLAKDRKQLQSKINKIAEEQRAAALIKEESERQRMAEAGQYKELLEKTRGEYEQKLRTVFGQLRTSRITAELVSTASEHKARSPKNVQLLLDRFFDLSDDGAVVIRTDDLKRELGIDALDEYGNQRTVGSVVAEFLAHNKEFVASDVQSGAGTKQVSAALIGGLPANLQSMTNEQLTAWLADPSNREVAQRWYKEQRSKSA